MTKEKNTSISKNIIVAFFQSVLYGVLFLAYIVFLVVTFPFRIVKKAFTKSKPKKVNINHSESISSQVKVHRTKAEKKEFAQLLKEKKKDLKRQKDNIKKAWAQRKKEKARLAKKRKEERKRRKAEIARMKAEIKQERKDLLRAKKEDMKRQKENREKIIEARKKAKEKSANLEKEQEKIDKKEAEERRKHQLEAFANDKYDIEAKKKEAQKNPFLMIISAPRNVIEWFKNKYKNSLLYKNAQAKKDKQHQIMTINFDGADAIKSEQKQIFEYVAKSPEGKIVKDHFPAYSVVEVHSFLLSEGYEVYSIKTSKMINILYKSANTTKFKTKDLIFFLTQLSTYVKAGIPLVEALKILS